MSRKKRFRPARCRPEKTRRKNHAVCRTGAAVRPVGNRVRPDVRRKKPKTQGALRRSGQSVRNHPTPCEISAVGVQPFTATECVLPGVTQKTPALQKTSRLSRKSRPRTRFPGTRAKFPRRAERKGIRGFSVRRGCLFLFLFFRQRGPRRVLRAGAAKNAPLLRVFTARTSPGIPRMPRGIPDSRSLRTGASCACRGCAARCPAHSRQCWSSGR